MVSMSTAAARLDEHREEDLAEPTEVDTWADVTPEMRAELRRRLSRADELLAKGLLLDANDILP